MKILFQLTLVARIAAVSLFGPAAHACSSFWEIDPTASIESVFIGCRDQADNGDPDARWVTYLLASKYSCEALSEAKLAVLSKWRDEAARQGSADAQFYTEYVGITESDEVDEKALRKRWISFRVAYEKGSSAAALEIFSLFSNYSNSYAQLLNEVFGPSRYPYLLEAVRRDNPRARVQYARLLLEVARRKKKLGQMEAFETFLRAEGVSINDILKLALENLQKASLNDEAYEQASRMLSDAYAEGLFADTGRGLMTGWDLIATVANSSKDPKSMRARVAALALDSLEMNKACDLLRTVTKDSLFLAQVFEMNKIVITDDQPPMSCLTPPFISSGDDCIADTQIR